ncbi:MAG: endonuclease/exonuclease/phosphatase family protein [Bacteroidales bacterium]|jgi:endonuclease/exonuclease/phosphatase family metal-dependent hydrolase|nr:endonuclease/exonuclease/phosphatase family protein [Bacteroidales bacterium]
MNNKRYKIFLLPALFLFTLLPALCPARGPQAEKELIVLSYNVRNCRGLDNLTDYKRVAGIIKRIDADIVALQELDSATQRSNGVVVINELSAATGMHASFGASISFQGGKYGIGILSREKPLNIKSVPLPGREEKRSLLVAEFDDFIFCCTHLSLNEEDRLESAGIINGLFEKAVKPVFLAGDLNAVPESAPVKTLETKWTMLNNPMIPTIPADNPRRCIDYIFILKSRHKVLSPPEARVEPESLASDHLPVWVRIRIKE